MTEGLRLSAPDVAFERAYLEMLADWQQTGEKLVPFVLRMDPSDFPAMVRKLEGYGRGENIPESFVPHLTYCLIDPDNRILGVVNIRPRLNENLRVRGGHIGYGVRPSERGKGYATAMLRLALTKAWETGLDRVLLTCDQDNIASARVIMKNGGRLDAEEMMDGVAIQRYWIDREPLP